ncbi:DUF6221 family protein [Streptomyces sp. NPDC048188]|uniref:DUF6221 family protein n=1 Tax=Streptomyces sp. NPDC048188 TaxID=3155749 RepID=UPI003446DCCC
MTVSEIALEHGVSRQTVHSYRTRGSFPKPIEGEGSTRPRFRADQVAAWFTANPPRPGKRTDLAQDEGVPVESTRVAVPPGEALEAARELVQWLRAQLNNDEEVATAPTRATWASAEWGFSVVDGDPHVDLGTVHLDPVSGLNELEMRHIAEHDPARVLREVDARRRILDRFATAVEDRVALRARMREVTDTDPDEFGRLHREESGLIEAAEHLVPVVRLLALPYADRPGYRDEWRP